MAASSFACAIRAGTVYFLLLFTAGFALGTLRVLFLVPKIGELHAVLAEVPVMLALSWITARRILRRRPVLDAIRLRLTMGGIALLLLISAETMLAILVFGRKPTDFLGSFGTAPGLTGLAGQLAFALIPLLQRRVGMKPQTGR